MVRERHLRVHGAFTDFDPLRRGYCNMSHVRTVCTYLNIALEDWEFKALGRIYCIPNWHQGPFPELDEFNYREFCNDVNELPLYPQAASALSHTDERCESQATSRPATSRPQSSRPASRPTPTSALGTRPVSARNPVRNQFALGKPADPEHVNL